MNGRIVERDGKLWFEGDMPEKHDDDLIVVMAQGEMKYMTRRDRDNWLAQQVLVQDTTESSVSNESE